MICQTIKAGQDCAFMSKKGCGFNGGSCYIISEKCGGCGRITEQSAGQYCRVYPDPSSKWLSGNCPTASHIRRDIRETSQKLNPLKASKRSSKH